MAQGRIPSPTYTLPAKSFIWSELKYFYDVTVILTKYRIKDVKNIYFA